MSTVEVAEVVGPGAGTVSVDQFLQQSVRVGRATRPEPAPYIGQDDAPEPPDPRFGIPHETHLVKTPHPAGHQTVELVIPTIEQTTGIVNPKATTSGISPAVGTLVWFKASGHPDPMPAMVSHVWPESSGRRAGSLNLSVLRPDGTWGPAREVREDAARQLDGHWFVETTEL